MDLTDQRRSEEVQAKPSRLRQEVSRRNALAAWYLRQYVGTPQPKSEFSDSVRGFEGQQYAESVPAMKNYARHLSEQGAPQVDTPPQYQSSVVGRTIPEDMLWQLHAIEALRRSRP